MVNTYELIYEGVLIRVNTYEVIDEEVLIKGQHVWTDLWRSLKGQHV